VELRHFFGDACCSFSLFSFSLIWFYFSFV
jgi:hypothetical protein